MAERAGVEFERSFTIASYNIHRCIGTDGVRSPERIIAVLRELAADVVALQEVESGTAPLGALAHLALLARETTLTAVPGPTLEDRRGDYGNAILTRYPVVTARQVDLSVPGREPRGAVAAELAIGPRVVRVVNAHLGLRNAERQLQLERLLAAVPSAGHPLLLLGDFNEWMPQSSNLRRLRARFGPGFAPRTFPSWRPLLPLDRIWGEPRAIVAAVRPHRSTLSVVASDHLPLRATVSV